VVPQGNVPMQTCPDGAIVPADTYCPGPGAGDGTGAGATIREAPVKPGAVTPVAQGSTIGEVPLQPSIVAERPGPTAYAGGMKAKTKG